jgi:hypothetical protein
MLAGLRVESPARRPAAPYAPREIGIVDQRPFDAQGDGMRLRARQRGVLARAAWVDRPRRIARIPIERAMDLVAQGYVRPAAPASPAP